MLMSQFRLFLSVALLSVAMLSAASPYAAAREFIPKTWKGVRYQEMVCRPDTSAPCALVVFLHGRSGSGTDNVTQLNQEGVRAIASYLSENKVNAKFIVPQCPDDFEWVARRDMPGYLDRVEALVLEKVKDSDIDKTRVYLSGVSMGAVGAWRFLKDCPDLFAAALIGSGVAPGTDPTDYLIVQLYVTVGSEERSLDRLQALTAEIDGGGGKVQFDVLQGLGHRQACEAAFTPERIGWLLSQ